jgi:uncharacterized Tic20 family protein
MLLILVAFFCGIMLDIAWSKTVSAVANKQALVAANLSVLLYLFTVVATVLIVEQCFMACFAYALGNWVGTYFTVRYWT